MPCLFVKDWSADNLAPFGPESSTRYGTGVIVGRLGETPFWDAVLVFTCRLPETAYNS
jgi:hypothetical protein